jgi:hypothetical protein
MRVELPSFIIIHVTLEKSFRVLFRLSSSPLAPIEKTRMSSTKRSWVT